MTDAEGVLARARQFLFVRETGPNAGPWVEAIQRIGRTKVGEPWCCAFVSFVLELWYDGKPPLKSTASCDVMLVEARAKGMEVKAPKPGDLFFVMKSPTDAVHVGFVTKVNATTFASVEGNTNPDGGREGYGVFERTSRKLNGAYVFVRYTK